MANWEKLDENTWTREATLVSASVIRKSGTAPWTIIIIGRDTFDVERSRFMSLTKAKYVATRRAQAFLKESLRYF